MKRFFFVFAITLLYVLHQDFWFWDKVEPIVFGFMPIGLFYHACYTVAVSILMWVIVAYAWPDHLEAAVEEYENMDVSVSANSAEKEDGSR